MSTTTSTKALIGVLLAGTVGVIIFLFVHVSSDPGKPISVGTSKAAACSKGQKCLPDVSYTDTNGHVYAAKDLAGKVVVVNFWATWCVPCREEMPAFSRLQERWASKGVQFVGLARDEPAKVARFARDVPVSYPLWVGDEAAGELSRRLGNRLGVLPHTVILGRDARLLDNRVGPHSEATLDLKLQALTEIDR